MSMISLRYVHLIGKLIAAVHTLLLMLLVALLAILIVVVLEAKAFTVLVI